MTDDELMRAQMKHVEGIGDVTVFDVRKPAAETLREIADSWKAAEENAVADFLANTPDATPADEAAFRLLARDAIRDIAMGRAKS